MKLPIVRRALLFLTTGLLAAGGTPSSAATPDASPLVRWLPLQPAQSPPARDGLAMAYDPVSQKVVMFGGYGASGYLNDTWLFDGRTWKRVTGAGPSARSAAGMAFDAVSRTLVLFGGFRAPNYLDDTWIWDGATSRWRAARLHAIPPPMTGAAVFTDPLTGHAAIFGGETGQFFSSTTWRAARMNWEQLKTPNAPSARAFMVCGTDPRNNTTVIFGGLADVNPANTWTWDGTQWTQRTPTVQPPLRFEAGTAYDPALASVVTFGGGSGSNFLNDTWAWTGNVWKNVSPAISPPQRGLMGMTYDAALGHIVLFGGLSSAGVMNDTWELLP